MQQNRKYDAMLHVYSIVSVSFISIVHLSSALSLSPESVKMWTVNCSSVRCFPGRFYPCLDSPVMHVNAFCSVLYHSTEKAEQAQAVSEKEYCYHEQCNTECLDNI
jgi:hypothetical protein